MEKLFLTPEDQEFLDPTHIVRDKLKRIPLSNAYYAEPSRWFTEPGKVWQMYLRRLDKYRDIERHAPYYQYLEEMLQKCGRQGGHYAFNDMVGKVEEYYLHAHNTRHLSPVLIQGRDYLIRLIKQRINMDRIIIPDYLTGIKNTYAGIPTGLRKGDYFAETVGAKPWRHMYPCVPGQRRMRQKDRVIFQDSVLNVRYIEKELTTVRQWLTRNFPQFFNAWMNPMLVTNPMLTKAVIQRANFIETDYVGMDIHFSLELVEQIIFPIYECLIPGSFLSFACAVTELFYQPVYLGNHMLTGLHNLFSGEVITNDFETLYTVCLALGIALEHGLLEDMTMAVLGDDCTLALPHRISTSRCRKIMDHMIDISNQADMLIHSDDKSRIGAGEARFCRKVYYQAGAKSPDGTLLGAYPSCLAINNILYPESPINVAGVAAIADLSRLDNIYGVPEFAEVCQLVNRYSTHKFTFSDEDVEAFANQRDWWYRLYGEAWNPAASKALEFITKL